MLPRFPLFLGTNLVTRESGGHLHSDNIVPVHLFRGSGGQVAMGAIMLAYLRPEGGRQRRRGHGAVRKGMGNNR